jgi:hypothetical protein
MRLFRIPKDAIGANIAIKRSEIPAIIAAFLGGIPILFPFLLISSISASVILS